MGHVAQETSKQRRACKCTVPVVVAAALTWTLSVLHMAGTVQGDDR